MDAWQRDVGKGVWGIVCNFLFDGFVGILIADERYEFSGYVISIVYLIFLVRYLLSTYPSFFTSKPKVNGNEKISFLNFFFGGLIFGWFFQNNLSKKKKGVSHIVLAVLIGVYVVWSFLAGFCENSF